MGSPCGVRRYKELELRIGQTRGLGVSGMEGTSQSWEEVKLVGAGMVLEEYPGGSLVEFLGICFDDRSNISLDGEVYWA